MTKIQSMQIWFRTILLSTLSSVVIIVSVVGGSIGAVEVVDHYKHDHYRRLSSESMILPNISSMTGDMRKVMVTMVAASRMMVSAVLVTTMLVARRSVSSP